MAVRVTDNFIPILLNQNFHFPVFLERVSQKNKFKKNHIIDTEYLRRTVLVN